MRHPTINANRGGDEPLRALKSIWVAPRIPVASDSLGGEFSRFPL